jgi:hypothetical protein
MRHIWRSTKEVIFKDVFKTCPNTFVKHRYHDCGDLKPLKQELSHTVGPWKSIQPFDMDPGLSVSVFIVSNLALYQVG